ncbi:ABC transporter ATP-binding protein [Rhodococcus sp. IEGM1428]|uniref:ABC transporter ATP-binding protein n=1 Tax=Rhodococcus sp. IEGM1428 TaxID=3392191 RepID=UPI003D0B031F
MSRPILEVDGLVKRFRTASDGLGSSGDFVAVDDVTFSVEQGSSLAVVGESGSGKSTIGRIIVGLERASAGSIAVGGSEWTPTRWASRHQRRGRGRQVQMVFQDPYQSLDRRQKVRDCIDECLRLHSERGAEARRSRVDELLDQVGLDDRMADALPRDLSGGQRQRVAIARALAAEPDLLILDEAVAALDVAIQAQVLRLLDTIRASTGIAYLFISHDLAVVRQVCDNVIVMRHGAIVESGPTESVLAAPQHPYTQLLIESIPRPGWIPQRRSTDHAFTTTAGANDSNTLPNSRK